MRTGLWLFWHQKHIAFFFSLHAYITGIWPLKWKSSTIFGRICFQKLLVSLSHWVYHFQTFWNLLIRFGKSRTSVFMLLLIKFSKFYQKTLFSRLFSKLWLLGFFKYVNFSFRRRCIWNWISQRLYLNIQTHLQICVYASEVKEILVEFI